LGPGTRGRALIFLDGNSRAFLFRAILWINSSNVKEKMTNVFRSAYLKGSYFWTQNIYFNRESTYNAKSL
jgi:hypothetical protein